MTDEQRMRANARCYANVYKRRGQITQQPCRECGSEKSEMHHEDYARPLDVVWLCRHCHLTHHKNTTTTMQSLAEKFCCSQNEKSMT